MTEDEEAIAAASRCTTRPLRLYALHRVTGVSYDDLVKLSNVGGLAP